MRETIISKVSNVDHPTNYDILSRIYLWLEKGTEIFYTEYALLLWGNILCIDNKLFFTFIITILKVISHYFTLTVHSN